MRISALYDLLSKKHTAHIAAAKTKNPQNKAGDNCAGFPSISATKRLIAITQLKIKKFFRVLCLATTVFFIAEAKIIITKKISIIKNIGAIVSKYIVDSYCFDF